MADIARKTKRYPTDLTDDEWERIKLLLPKPPKRGRKVSVDLREMLAALGRRTDLRLDDTLTPPCARLRNSPRRVRSHDPCRHGKPAFAPRDPWLTFLKRSLSAEVFRQVRMRRTWRGRSGLSRTCGCVGGRGNIVPVIAAFALAQRRHRMSRSSCV
jgi:transposase